MNGDTYEFGKINTKLESIEWDDVWLHFANTDKRKKILTIGDSISRGYRDIFIKKLNQNEAAPYTVDNIATSKGVDNKAFYPLLDGVKMQIDKYSVIKFNNGLHGWHLEDKAYECEYRNLVNHIKELYPDAKLVIALTTPVRSIENLNEVIADRDNVIKARNEAAIKIAEEVDAEVVDYYSLLLDRPELYMYDGVHLKEEGYELLANASTEIFDSILKA